MRMRKNSRGFTLIEILVVLAIIAIIAAVAVRKATRAETATSSQRLTDEISMIATQARVWKGTRTAYTGISVTSLTAMDYLDSEWGDGTGAHPSGGNYSLAASGGGTQFTVTATSLTTQLCGAAEHQLEPATVNGNTASCAGGTLSATFR